MSEKRDENADMKEEKDSSENKDSISSSKTKTIGHYILSKSIGEGTFGKVK